MPPVISYPMFNGRRLSPRSSSLDVNGLSLVGWKSLDMDVENNPVVMRGNRRLPQGMTAGSVNFTGSLELYAEEAKLVKASLGLGFMDTMFTINLTLFDPQVVIAVTRTGLGARIKKVTDNVGDSDDPITEKWDLVFMQILHDGLPVIAETPF